MNCPFSLKKKKKDLSLKKRALEITGFGRLRILCPSQLLKFASPPPSPLTSVTPRAGSDGVPAYSFNQSEHRHGH